MSDDPLFESPQEAWHFAFACREGIQDPFTPKVGTGTKPCGASHKELEARKVKALVNGLPPTVKDMGVWSFSPEGTSAVIKARDKILQRTWKFVVALGAGKHLQFFSMTNRVLILVAAVVEEARFRANDESKLSHACVASRMGINASSFSRSWKPIFEDAVAVLEGEAREAITPVSILVDDINRKYVRPK